MTAAGGDRTDSADPRGGGAAAAGALGALQAIRATAEAADGRIRVVLDGTSDLVELELTPEAMRLSSQDLQEAIAAAFAQARREAQAQARSAAGTFAAPALDPASLARLGDLGTQSLRRVEQMMAAVEQISARMGQPPR
jgi:DNA-binding protein YbaB